MLKKTDENKLIVLLALIYGKLYSMHGVNIMLVSILPTYFKKYGNRSTASGVVNACTYIGSAASAYLSRYWRKELAGALISCCGLP